MRPGWKAEGGASLGVLMRLLAWRLSCPPYLLLLPVNLGALVECVSFDIPEKVCFKFRAPG